jgi:hypothetical protein
MVERARRVRGHCALGPRPCRVANILGAHRHGRLAQAKTEVRVLGFANAYDAPSAILWALFLAPVWLAAQPSAQISLALVTLALFAHLELIDAARDARALHASLAADSAAYSLDCNRAC